MCPQKRKTYFVLLQTRRSEIILVLFIDMVFFGKYPGAIEGIGYGKKIDCFNLFYILPILNLYQSLFYIYCLLLLSVIVLISVVGMANDVANDLQKWIDNKFKSQTTHQNQTYELLKRSFSFR